MVELRIVEPQPWTGRIAALGLRQFTRDIVFRCAAAGWTLRGRWLSASGRHEAALECFDRVLADRPHDVAALRRRGVALDRLGRYDEALAVFDEALRVSPDFSELHRARGDALSKLDRDAEAIEAYTACLAARQNDAAALWWRGAAYKNTDDLDAALVDLEAAARLDPHNSDVHYWHGLVLKRLERYDEAVAAYDRALRLAPRDPDVHLARGHALSWIDRREEAVDAYTTCLKLRPDDFNALLWRGITRKNLDEDATALADLDAAGALKADDARVSYWRGVVHNRHGRYEASIAEHEAALRLDPKYARAQRGRGHALSWLDRWDEAGEAYQRAIDLDAENAGLWRDKAVASLSTRQYDQALYEIDRAIGLVPDSSEYHRERARIWWWTWNYDAALDDCAAALRLDPENGNAHRLRGKLFDQLHEHDEAIACLDRALEVEPTRAQWWEDRGQVWMGLGELRRAESDFRKALECDSKLGSTWQELAKLYTERGEHGAAVEALDRAIELQPDTRELYRTRAQSLEELQEYARADADYEFLEEHDTANDPDSDMKIANTRLLPILREHFDPTSLNDLSLVERKLSWRMRPDLQRAVEAWIAAEGEVVHFSGVRGVYNSEGIGITDLMGAGGQQGPVLAVPPEYDDLSIGEDEPVRCIKVGIWLFRRGSVPCAVISSQGGPSIRLQIATPEGDAGEKIAADFTRAMEEAARNARAYRGKVLSLDLEDEYDQQTAGIRVHHLRTVGPDDIILPARTLELLERNVIGFARQRDRFRRRGMSTRKGLLFYGPPGTGKTLTIHYLARAMPGHTTLLVSADQVGSLAEYMTLARMLQPSIVVIEDVDLIARTRTQLRSAVEETLLNRLLNEMDGLREDAEIIFVLTTNYPEHLEEALASRPGRIDQAIEFPLPDDEGRRKLAQLYSGGQLLGDDVLEELVRRTDGVSASFVRELLRRAMQFQMERAESDGSDADGPLTCEDVAAALDELLVAGGALNAKLLGGAAVKRVKGFNAT